METTTATYQPEHLQPWTADGPTSWDSSANYAGADLSDFYVAPVGINRDTVCTITLSNWRVMCAELDKLCGHDESGAHSFGHWACGWYEIYLIHHSDSEALKAADEMAAALSDYPILDESDEGELECEQQEEYWENHYRSEAVGAIENALADYAPDDADSWWENEAASAIETDWLDYVFWDSSPQWESDCDGSPRLCGLADWARDPEILRRLTGLNLLAPGQQWRTEPYPFNGADPEPLEKGLPLTCEEVSATVAAYSAAKIKQARAQSV
jgi:hypothetical protein